MTDPFDQFENSNTLRKQGARNGRSTGQERANFRRDERNNKKFGKQRANERAQYRKDGLSGGEARDARAYARDNNIDVSEFVKQYQDKLNQNNQPKGFLQQAGDLGLSLGGIRESPRNSTKIGQPMDEYFRSNDEVKDRIASSHARDAERIASKQPKVEQPKVDAVKPEKPNIAKQVFSDVLPKQKPQEGTLSPLKPKQTSTLPQRDLDPDQLLAQGVDNFKTGLQQFANKPLSTAGQALGIMSEDADKVAGALGKVGNFVGNVNPSLSTMMQNLGGRNVPQTDPQVDAQIAQREAAHAQKQQQEAASLAEFENSPQRTQALQAQRAENEQYRQELHNRDVDQYNERIADDLLRENPRTTPEMSPEDIALRAELDQMLQAEQQMQQVENIPVPQRSQNTFDNVINKASESDLLQQLGHYMNNTSNQANENLSLGYDAHQVQPLSQMGTGSGPNIIEISDWVNQLEASGNIEYANYLRQLAQSGQLPQEMMNSEKYRRAYRLQQNQ